MKISKYHKTILFCCVVFASGSQLAIVAWGLQDMPILSDIRPKSIKQNILIIFHNQNNKVLQAALRYQTKNGQWVTGGWYKLNPNEKKSIAKTDNAIVYVYAESIAPKDSRIYWNRTDRYYRYQ